MELYYGLPGKQFEVSDHVILELTLMTHGVTTKHENNTKMFQYLVFTST